MNSWFRRGRSTLVSSRNLRRRSAESTRIDYAELSPGIDEFLGQVAYSQLAFFHFISDLASDAESLEDSAALSRVAGRSLTTHEQFATEITLRDADPISAMEPYVERTDRYLALVRGNSGLEGVLTAFVSFEFLNDFYVSLARGLGEDHGVTLGSIIDRNRTGTGLFDILHSRIVADPRRAHMMALWGRRVVGDTLLFASGLLRTHIPDSGGRQIEPAFTELIATHTRRMDGLGLTA